MLPLGSSDVVTVCDRSTRGMVLGSVLFRNLLKPLLSDAPSFEIDLPYRPVLILVREHLEWPSMVCHIVSLQSCSLVVLLIILRNIVMSAELLL